MKNNIIVIILSLSMIFMLVGCDNENTVVNDYKVGSKIEENFQIRFKDLVELKTLQKYNNKTVSAVGYLSPIMGYDNSFGYLMNLPYQTCPYCVPGDTRITNTIAIFMPEGEKIDFTEAAVVVTGTLKLENYTDDYGYEYTYRIVDAEIKVADVETVGEKTAIYNKIADKNILDNIMNSLYEVDNNVYCKEYMYQGYEINVEVIDPSKIETALNDLKELNEPAFETLRKVANNLKLIINSTNKLIENDDLNSLANYQGKVEECFNAINNWMAEYEL